MKTIFDQSTRDEIKNRINALTENSSAQWGKMNVYQALKHCILFEEMMLGKKVYDRVFIGRIFGKMALKKLLKDETPLKKNEPTSSGFKIKETSGNVQAEKNKWISLVEEYAYFSGNDFEHWFFGKNDKRTNGAVCV